MSDPDPDAPGCEESPGQERVDPWVSFETFDMSGEGGDLEIQGYGEIDMPPHVEMKIIGEHASVTFTVSSGRAREIADEIEEKAAVAERKAERSPDDA